MRRENEVESREKKLLSVLKQLILIDEIKFYLVCVAKFWLVEGEAAEPLLAKAKPIHDGGSSPGITDVRRGNRHWAKQA